MKIELDKLKKKFQFGRVKIIKNVLSFELICVNFVMRFSILLIVFFEKYFLKKLKNKYFLQKFSLNFLFLVLDKKVAFVCSFIHLN